MNFFKSSFFSDFKLPDVLAQPQPLLPPASQTPQPEAASRSSDEIGWEQHWGPDDEADPAQDSNSNGQDAENLLDADQRGKKNNSEQAVDVWSFGTLVKSLTSKSEEVLQAYRRDLQEFSSGLKKETEVIREVAAHAVMDLPNSLEVGASVAQESLETVGLVIEEFGSSVWKGTTEILAQGKEAVLKVNADDSSDAIGGAVRYASTPSLGGRYSRFEAQVNAMQHDSATYCDEPEDEEDYKAWRSTLSLDDKKDEIESVLNETAFVEELQSRIVPRVLDYETFWTRYFYRLNKLRQAEAARADLVKRAAADEEEDLTWDSDEDIEEEEANQTQIGTECVLGEVKAAVEVEKQIGEDNETNVEVEAEGVRDNTRNSEDKASVKGVGAPTDRAQSNSTIDLIVEEEEDSGWEVAEDIEDSSGSEGKKSSNSEASWEVPEGARPDIRKRFNTVEEEEDLSWDVDDEDDDVKP